MWAVTSFYIVRARCHIYLILFFFNFRLTWTYFHPFCSPIYSSMPFLRDWRHSPRGKPTLVSRCAACHAVATATLAAAPCQTFTLSLLLHAPTRERTQSWCCRLQGSSPHRNVWPQMWHLTRTSSQPANFSTQFWRKHTRDAFVVRVLIQLSAMF